MKWHAYTTELRDRFSEFKKASVLYRWAVIISLIILLANFALLLWRLAPFFEPGQSIPLHYNIYFGIDIFGQWERLFLLPAIGALFLFLNFIAQLYFVRRIPLLALFFACGTILVEAVLLISLLFVVLMNV